MAKSKAKAKKPVKKAAAKKTAKKIGVKHKVTAKNKIKKPANPHEGKRYFMIEFGGYGGEFLVNHASEEFVKYWLNKKRSGYLTDHILSMHERAAYGEDDIQDDDDSESDEDSGSGFDSNSPPVLPDKEPCEYWDLDDIDHDTTVSAEGSGVTVVEVDLHPKAVYRDGAVEWDDKERKKRNFDWSQKTYTQRGESQDYATDALRRVYSTEMFVNKTTKGVVDPVPVLMMYDAQKGTFYRVVVETQGEDFDINKFVIAVNENSMTTGITQHFYDGKSVSTDHDWLSTWGKGFFAEVGWIPRGDLSNDHDELLAQGWRDLEENS
jgi:hypothetical protein